MLVPKSARTPGKARLWTSKRGRSRNLPWQKTIPSGRHGWPRHCVRICAAGKRRAASRTRQGRARATLPPVIPAQAGIHKLARSGKRRAVLASGLPFSRE